MAREADKHPKDFEITKETGITIKQEAFFPEDAIPAESRLLAAVLENEDYGNSKKLTLEFERHTSESALLPYRDFISFYRRMEVKEVVSNLRRMADNLERHCVDELQK